MPSTTSSLDKQQKIAIDIIDQWMSYQHFIHELTGVSIAVVHKEKVLFTKGYGFADVKAQKAATPSTLYRIASCSKLFTSVAVMQLWERGLISLDDRVSKYLRWFQSDKDAYLREITIRQLLNHSSGIQRDAETAHWEDEEFPSADQLKEMINKKVTLFESNEKWKYSNLGFAILGQIIETASGMKYSAYVKKYILQPLGLTQTTTDYAERLEGKLATGYGRLLPGKNRSVFSTMQTNAMSPAAGAITNVNELAEYVMAQFWSNEKLLSRHAKREMQRIQWVDESSQPPLHFGLGFETYQVDGVRVFGHSGGIQGYSSHVLLDPKQEIGVVVLTNAIDGQAYRLANGIFHIINYVLKQFDRLPYALPEKTKTTRYTGEFTGIWGDANVVDINRSLVMYFPGYDLPFSMANVMRKMQDEVFQMYGEKTPLYGEEYVKYFFEKGAVKKMQCGASFFYPWEKQ